MPFLRPKTLWLVGHMPALVQLYVDTATKRSFANPYPTEISRDQVQKLFNLNEKYGDVNIHLAVPVPDEYILLPRNRY